MSDVKSVPINDADYSQLKAFAESHGLEVKHGTNASQIRARILAAFPDTTEITLAAVAEAKPVATATTTPAQTQPASSTATATATETAPAKAPEEVVDVAEPEIGLSHHFDPKVTIRIPPTKDAGGDRDVPVGVNGNTFLIQRGVDVAVPYRVYEALNNAVETNYEWQTDRNTNVSTMVEREAHAFDFSVLKMQSEEEVEAWRQRVASHFAP